MAIGLDTSVVLRLLIGEPRAQMEVARRRVERGLTAGEKVLVTDLVVAEACHALRHHYGVPEPVALGRLREFLASDVVHLDPVGAGEALHGARGQAGVVDRSICSTLDDLQRDAELRLVRVVRPVREVEPHERKLAAWHGVSKNPVPFLP